MHWLPREGGGEILIKRMLYLKIIECIGCQEGGGGKKNVGFENG